MRCLVVLLVAFGTTCAIAQEGMPIEFKGIVLGQPYPDNEVTRRLRCDGNGAKCFYSFRAFPPLPDPLTVAGIPLRALVIDRHDGVVEMIYITISASDFERVSEAFREKYRSMRCAETSVQTRAGVALDQVECTYRDAVGVLTLKKRAGGVDESNVFATAHALIERLKRERAGTRKDL